MADRLMVYNTITGHINQDEPCGCDNCRVAMNERQDYLPVPAWNQSVEEDDVSERHAPASNPFAEPLRYVEKVPKSEHQDYLPMTPSIDFHEVESHPEPEFTFNTFNWPGEGQRPARKAVDDPNAETLMPYQPDAMQWTDSGA